MFDERYATFQAYGISHVVALIVGVGAVTLMLCLRKKIQRSRFYEILCGCVMLLLEGVFLTWTIRNHGLRPEQLPLQLCTISLYVNVFMLLSGRLEPFRYTCFWTLTGPILAFLIPMQGYDFPHFRYLHYYLNHLLILLSTVYFFLVSKKHVTLKDALWSEGGMTALVLFVIHPINYCLNTDFMFLTHNEGYFSTIFAWQNVVIWFAAAAVHQALFWLYHRFLSPRSKV